MEERLSMGKRKELFFGPLLRKEMRLSGGPSGILIEAFDYHADPVHLTREELWELGVVVPRKEPEGLQASCALRWRTDGSRYEPRGELPEGPYLGEYVVARVDGGLDVFLVSYSGGRQRVDTETLQELGLRMRKTPLRSPRRKRLGARAVRGSTADTSATHGRGL